jgi:hypothetical protein
VNSAAARMGPTVCELEGPIPILNKSKTLIATINLLHAFQLCGHHRDLRRAQKSHTDAFVSKAVRSAIEGPNGNRRLRLHSGVRNAARRGDTWRQLCRTVGLRTAGPPDRRTAAS